MKELVLPLTSSTSNDQQLYAAVYQQQERGRSRSLPSSKRVLLGGAALENTLLLSQLVMQLLSPRMSPTPFHLGKETHTQLQGGRLIVISRNSDCGRLIGPVIPEASVTPWDERGRFLKNEV